MEALQSNGMTHFFPSVPSCWQQQQQQWQQQQQQQHVHSYGRRDGLVQQQCMQPMPASMHPWYSNPQQSWGPGALAAPSFEQWQSNACAAQQQNSHCQTSAGPPTWEPKQHAPLVMPHQAAMHQVHMQAGPAAYPAAASAVTSAVNAAGSPWVQRAWYPTMPAGLQLPLGNPYLHAEPSRSRPQASAANVQQSKDQHVSDGHAEHVSISSGLQGLERDDQQACSAVSGTEASQHQSPQMQTAHRQQPADATPTVDGSVSACPRLRNLSKGPPQRGVIKAYNLEALIG